MVEELLSYAMLLKQQMISLDKYNDYLNEVFLKHSDNDLLLELQWCSSDSDKTVDTIMAYVFDKNIDNKKFGSCLFEQLRHAYDEMEISNFGKKAYSVWNMLPKGLEQVEPFWTLCYADDPLSWGDEEQTRELYEKMFNYYK